ncbi:hypothetical protein AAMO2058_000593700 [Amorphochlora amoebiformis]
MASRPADVLDSPRFPEGRWQEWGSRFPNHFVAGKGSAYKILDACLYPHTNGTTVKWTFRFKENAGNLNGTVHGGATFSILDSLVNTSGYYNQRTKTATATGSIVYKRPALIQKTYIALSFPISKCQERGEDEKENVGRKKRKKYKYVAELREEDSGKLVATSTFQLVRWDGLRPTRQTKANLKAKL